MFWKSLVGFGWEHCLTRFPFPSTNDSASTPSQSTNENTFLRCSPSCPPMTAPAHLVNQPMRAHFYEVPLHIHQWQGQHTNQPMRAHQVNQPINPNGSTTSPKRNLTLWPEKDFLEWVFNFFSIILQAVNSYSKNPSLVTIDDPFLGLLGLSPKNLRYGYSPQIVIDFMVNVT